MALPSTSTQAQAIAAASNKYHVPVALLLGIYGMETAFGTNVTTSSAGAVGPFQFIPSTARQYGYPLTNTPNDAQFAQQADAMARYLSDLYKQTGSWDSAVHHYSGGGYGLSDVMSKYKEVGFDLLAAIKSAGGLGVGGAGGVAGAIDTTVTAPFRAVAAVASGAETASKIWEWLTTPAKWLIILKFAGGALLLFWGLKELTGANVPTVRVA